MRSFFQHSFCFCFVLLFISSPSYSAIFEVNTFDDAIDSSPGDGFCNTQNNNCSLRAAVMESNSLLGADKINLPVGSYTLTIGNIDEDKSIEGDLDIFDDLSIVGAVDGLTIISGNNLFRVFNILQAADGSRPAVNLANLTLTQGLQNNINDVASIILNRGLLFLDNVTVEQAGVGTIAIVSLGAYLQILNSRINNNDRAIYVFKSQLDIKDTDIKQNVSTVNFSGAGVISDNSRVSLINVNIEENSALTLGGGISANQSSKFTIFRSSISNNSASDDPLIDKTFGGGLYFNESDLDIKESNILNNNATTAGGGIWFGRGNLLIKKTIIANNVAVNGGGGLFYAGADSGAQLTTEFKMSESKIMNNQSKVGGGIFIARSDRTDNIINIARSEITQNKADSGAGLIYFDNGKLTIQNTTISSNQANLSGGGLYVEPASSSIVDIQSTTIANNSGAAGSNVFSRIGTVSLTNTIISDGVGATDCNIALNSNGYNLDSDNSCGLSVDLNDKPGVDAQLDVLTDNGGFTRTHGLLGNSPAINSGDDVLCETLNTLDQRNFYRGNSVCDIGAMEFESTLALTGEIKFAVNQVTANESDSSVNFSIKRINGSEGGVSVYVYTTTESTAKINDDYFFNASIVSWADGDIEDKILTTRLVDNDIADGNKAIIVTMGLPEGNVGLAPNQKLVIDVQDDESLPGEIEFAQSEFVVSESKSSVNLVVIRKNGSFGDITFTMQSLEFGVIEATITEGQRGFLFEMDLKFAQDSIFDGDQRIKFSLTSVDNGATIGALSTADLVIEDDEALPINPGEFSFQKLNYSVNEAQGDLLITVLRKEGLEGNAYVDLELISGSAEFNLDFGGVNSVNVEKVSLIFEDGQNQVVVKIQIKNDTIVEREEFFQLKLSNPLGGPRIGDISLASVKIVDDEIAAKPAKGSPSNSKVKSGSGGAIDGIFLILILSLGLFFRNWYKFREDDNGARNV